MQFDNKKNSPREVATPGPQSVCLSDLRILVIDDNPVNRQMAAGVLEKLGCKVDTAVDGQTAVEMHARVRYDLLLMDCEMPGLDGYEATRRIRAAEDTTSRTPIIALSASISCAERDDCLAAGMDDFLSKPLRPQPVAEALQRVLQAMQPTEAAVPVQDADELDAVRVMFGDDFAELAALYQRDTPSRLAALRAALSTGDGARMATLAHMLAGSSMSIGATRLSGLCKELETQVRAQGTTVLDDRLDAVDAEYARIRDKLQRMLD